MTSLSFFGGEYDRNSPLFFYECSIGSDPSLCGGNCGEEAIVFWTSVSSGSFGGGVERNCVNCCSVFCAAVMCIVDCKNDYVSSLPLFNVSHCI